MATPAARGRGASTARWGPGESVASWAGPAPSALRVSRARPASLACQAWMDDPVLRESRAQLEGRASKVGQLGPLCVILVVLNRKDYHKKLNKITTFEYSVESI